LRLDEIVNPITNWITGPDEIAFIAARFRPVTEKKTDISIFTRMLNPSDRKVAETVE